jgi:hypothetical protein
MLRALEAGAYAQAGQVEEGLVMVDEALEISGRGSGTTVLPEFQLLKGDPLLALGQGNGADPEPWFRRAFDLAQRMRSRAAAVPGSRSERSHRPRHLHRRLRHGRSDRGTGPTRNPSVDGDLVEPRGI